MHSAKITASMLHECDIRLSSMLADGIAEDVALDRIWDCYEAAYEGLERHCFDPRDRLFETKLRAIAAKG